MSHNHPIPLDWVPVEDREKLIEFYTRLILKPESEYPNDRVYVSNPIFFCNSITPFCPVPFVFELTNMLSKYIGPKDIGIKIILQEEDGKLTNCLNRCCAIPIDDFKQLTKNLIFIPLYIPDNCSYYPF